MDYSCYRSTALKSLWPIIEKQLMTTQSTVCLYQNFSTIRIDNICAECWKDDDDIGVCVDKLRIYIAYDVLGY